MTGKALRHLREQLGMTQAQLAPLIGLSRSSLHHREARDGFLPESAVAGVLAIADAKRAGELRSLPQKTKSTWRESINFELKPPFEVLPAKGFACGCNDPRCGLTPVRDGEWPNRGHLWVFHGWRCNKRVYLDATGKNVQAPPRSEPIEVCSGCGRRRELGPRDSTRWGERIWHLRCRPQLSDPPGFQHDPPSYWWKRNGRLVRMPESAIELLHGRSRRSFPVPLCERLGCPRHGTKMERSVVLNLRLRDGSKCQIHAYRCRAPKPHASYRVLPRGEVAVRLGMGRYQWTDAATGKIVETARARRPISKDRIMPDSACPQCHAQLVAIDKEQKVWRVVRGKRRWKNPLRCWRAKCVSCGIFTVRNDGQIKPRKSRWTFKGRGRQKGKLAPCTLLRIRLCAAMELRGKGHASTDARRLYPRNHKIDNVKISARMLRSRHKDAIEKEKRLMTSFSRTELQGEIDRLASEIYALTGQ